jgi:hypothetical protein
MHIRETLNATLLISTRSHRPFAFNFEDVFAPAVSPRVSHVQVVSSVNYTPDVLFHNRTLHEVDKAAVKFVFESKMYFLDNQSLSFRAVLQHQRGMMRVIAGPGGGGRAPGSLGFVIQPNFLKLMRKYATYLVKPADNPYAALHFRNTDLSDNYTVVVKAVQKFYKPGWHNFLYLATDSATTIKRLQAHLPDIPIVSGVRLVPIPTYCPRCSQHYAPHSTLASRQTQFVNTLIDMYYIVKADVFVPSKVSGLSRWLVALRSEEKNKKVGLFSGAVL